MKTKKIVEAIIFASPEPISLKRLSSYLKKDEDEIEGIIIDLNSEYIRNDRAFFIRYIAGGYQFYIHPDFGKYIKEFLKIEGRKLSKSSLDVLAIVAVKQPVAKKVIDNIRRVSSDNAVHQLLELNLIKIVGKTPSIGHAYLYGTTPKFLSLFGLKSLNDLPKVDELDLMTEYSGELFENDEIPKIDNIENNINN